MHADIKQQWLKEMRSNEYTKCKGALRKGEKEFCPLGLLANIFNPQGWLIVKNSHLEYTYMGEYSYLPTAVAIEVDLQVPQSIIVHLSDNEDKSFAEIADFVEERA
jgi:hypothetical protein